MCDAVYEVFERMTYYGISSNLVLYLTRKLHQGTVTASDNVNNWVGTIYITPILGAYVADAHLGRYWTFVISSVIYLLVCLFTHFAHHYQVQSQFCHDLCEMKFLYVQIFVQISLTYLVECIINE